MVQRSNVSEAVSSTLFVFYVYFGFIPSPTWDSTTVKKRLWLVGVDHATGHIHGLSQLN